VLLDRSERFMAHKPGPSMDGSQDGHSSPSPFLALRKTQPACRLTRLHPDPDPGSTPISTNRSRIFLEGPPKKTRPADQCDPPAHRRCRKSRRANVLACPEHDTSAGALWAAQSGQTG